MFPLAGKSFPASGEELSTAIHDALAEVFTLSKKNAVTVDGGSFPAVKHLAIDLDGATVSATEPPPPPKPVGKRQAGITVDRLEVSGRPVKYQGSQLHMELSGRKVKLDFAKDKQGHPMLVLADAESGDVDAKMKKTDIRELLLAVGGAAAKQQGVTIQDVQLDLTSSGPRSVAVDAKVKAKKLMMSGTIRLQGRVDVDDALKATVSGLNCTGEGMVGTMAAGLVQGQLKAYEGKTFPLTAFSLGDLTVRDLKIDAKGADLHVTAKFGSK